jgi:hypothetical protein
VKYALIDCKPVPAEFDEELRALGLGNDVTLFSCLRTQDAVNFARSNGCQVSSQAELFDCFQRGVPGCNPANPPGRSTHELRNDGVAYPGPSGMKLEYWQCGIDSSNPQQLIARARQRGWVVTVTYPTNPREAHHVNFRKEAELDLTIRKGDKGKEVAQLTGRLKYLGYIDARTGGFGDEVERAVKKYQRDHDLNPDGVVGLHTATQLLVTVRHKKQCRRPGLKIGDERKREAALRKCGRRFGPK